MRKRKKPTVEAAPNGLLPDEDPDIRREAGKVVKDPAKWLAEPNDQLGGCRPKDLIGTEREQHLRDLLRAIMHGMPT